MFILEAIQLKPRPRTSLPRFVLGAGLAMLAVLLAACDAAPGTPPATEGETFDLDLTQARQDMAAGFWDVTLPSGVSYHVELGPDLANPETTNHDEGGGAADSGGIHSYRGQVQGAAKESSLVTTGPTSLYATIQSPGSGGQEPVSRSFSMVPGSVSEVQGHIHILVETHARDAGTPTRAAPST